MLKLMMMIIMIIKIIMIILNKLNNKKKKMNYFNSIECGFNQMNNKHISLSNNFFIILMIFLIFDLEFFILIPLLMLIKNFNWMKFLMMLTLIMMFIYYSMIYEIKINCINWIKLDKFMLFAMMKYNKYLTLFYL